jgi:hypothetical protein
LFNEKKPEIKGSAYSRSILAQDCMSVIAASRSDAYYQLTESKNLTKTSFLFD